MRVSVLTLLGLIISVPNAVGSDLPKADPLDGKIQKVLAAFDLLREGEAFQALFQAAGDTGLPQLKLHAHDTIALQAAWREVLLTVPEKEPARAVRPDRSKLDWFLGFLEGRGRLRIPSWWREAVLKTRANRRDNVYFEFEQVYEKAGLDHVAAPPGTTLTKEKGKILLKVEKQPATMPQSLLRTAHTAAGEVFYCNVSALMAPKRCYVAVHGNAGYAYPLACIERDSGQVVWKSTVWAAWCGGTTGIHFERVTVTQQDERIVVFGVSTTGAHVEAFRASDGKNLFRFSTYHDE
jgi:hypothetical protein